jgi:AraC-like DNA-binding protein
MDVLSDVLDTVRLRGKVFGSVELRPPWGMRAVSRDHFGFHVMVRGRGYLDAGGKSLPVSAGDVMVLGRGCVHTLKDAPRSRAKTIEEMLREGMFANRPRGAEGSTLLVCGAFQFDDLRGDMLLSSLPAVIHTHELASDAGPWLAQTVRLLAYEASSEQPGADIVVSRLCDALFVYVIRSVLARLPDGESSLLGALEAPQIGAALRLIHERPAQPWTVASLAEEVGMSRSAFAERFSRVVGESPMQYLTRWRLQKAASLLRGGDAGLAEVAARVGYESDAAFNKAFKRILGVTPGAYRRNLDAG